MRLESLTREHPLDRQIMPAAGSAGQDPGVTAAADPLGEVRHELLDRLGWEVARGVVARAAFRSGHADASSLRASLPVPSPEDLLQAGCGFDNLGGRTRARLNRVELDRERGTLHLAGDWLDSSEADQHLQRFGPGSQTVCWILEGYATGYATGLLGRDVLCIETACRGKGDPTCTFEIKPLENWGAEGDAFLAVLSDSHCGGRFDRCLRNISEMGCALAQSSPDAVITMDAAGIITSCSQQGQDLFGLPAGQLLGCEMAALYADGRSESDRIARRLQEEGRIRNYLTDLVTPDGRRVPVALAAYAVRDDVGEVIGTVSVVHNLTEIRRLEDELATKNRFMANILKDSADAIITLDPENNITSWNRGAEAIFGFTAAEAVGKHIRIIIPPELQAAREIDRITDTVRAHGILRTYQTERITKDGKRIQVIFTRTAILDDSGRFAGSSAVLKDVTNVLNLERQLADAEHLATLGELSAGLAHEIKNPLAGIKGAIDVIRDTLPVSDQHREILGDVLHEVGRIDQIVRDLLNYAKPKPPSHNDVDLEETAQRMVAIARQSPKSESVSIDVHVRGTIPAFTGDQTQLEQAFLNLLLNALNAVKAGGRIAVRLSYDRREGVIRAVVEDNGCGIPEEIRRKIFQPFFTTRTDGTGLGLATCLKNVQYHGGTIDVQSEVGSGTRFTVTLPLFCRL